MIRYVQGSHIFNDKKFQDFSRTFQDCQNVFQDLIGALQRLNIKTHISYLLYIQSVIQCVWNTKYFEIYHHCI